MAGTGTRFAERQAGPAVAARRPAAVAGVTARRPAAVGLAARAAGQSRLGGRPSCALLTARPVRRDGDHQRDVRDGDHLGALPQLSRTGDGSDEGGGEPDHGGGQAEGERPLHPRLPWTGPPSTTPSSRPRAGERRSPSGPRSSAQYRTSSSKRGGRSPTTTPWAAITGPGMTGSGPIRSHWLCVRRRGPSTRRAS